MRARLLTQVEERRNPRTNTTVDKLVRRHLGQFAGASNTPQMYRGHVKNHISRCWAGSTSAAWTDDDPAHPLHRVRRLQARRALAGAC